MAGKTGTAQVNNKADTSVFVAYGPVLPNVAPTYAIDVVIPEAGFGADFAAPLAFGIMKPVSQNQLPQVPTPPPAPPPGGGST
jgi:cell division protein FtsI/penicillin-binding protein 2